MSDHRISGILANQSQLNIPSSSVSERYSCTNLYCFSFYSRLLSFLSGSVWVSFLFKLHDRSLFDSFFYMNVFILFSLEQSKRLLRILFIEELLVLREIPENLLSVSSPFISVLYRCSGLYPQFSKELTLFIFICKHFVLGLL